jgi:hypothetical protein
MKFLNSKVCLKGEMSIRLLFKPKLNYKLFNPVVREDLADIGLPRVKLPLLIFKK